MVITRLNHAVLYVRDAQRTGAFFVDNLGFEVTASSPGGVFLKCSADSLNDHDFALFSIGETAGATTAGRNTVGMYHLAWEVPTLKELNRLHDVMRSVSALVGKSDHGVSKSLYCQDPDGLEFELMWAVPLDKLDAERDAVGVAPLNMAREISRFGDELAGRVTA